MQIHKSINLNILNHSRHNLFIAIAIAVTLVVSLVAATLHQNLFSSPSAAHAADTPTNEACFKTTGAATKTITNYYTHEGDNSSNPACPRDVVIPDTIAGIPVTAVSQYGMSGKGLTSLVIPSTLTPGSYNFSYNQISEIIIPEGIESIGGGAFRGNRISSVSLPSTLKSIGDRAFTDNFYISEIDLPDELTYIGPRAFWGNALTEITIPASVTTIAAEAFWNNYNTQTIIFEGDDIPSIGANAFWLSQLQTIQHKDAIFSHGDSSPPSEQCFYFDNGTISGYKSFSFDNLREGGDPCMRKRIMTIPESIDGIEVNHIASHAFSYSNLSQVNLPESLVSIEDYAFAYNTIESIVVPAKVETIGNHAFAGNSLESIVIENPNTIDQGSSWSDNSNLSSFIISGQTYTPVMGGLDCLEFNSESQTITGYEPPSNAWPSIASATSGTWVNECNPNLIIPSAIDGIAVLVIDDYAFERVGLKSVIIPEGVTYIGAYALANNNLTSITVPSSVSHLGYRALSYNYQLSEVIIEGDPSTVEDRVLRNSPIEKISYNGQVYDSSQPFHESCLNFETNSGQIYGLIKADLINVKNNSQACLSPDIVIPDSINGVNVYSISSWAFDDSGVGSVTIHGNPTLGSGAFAYNGLNKSTVPEEIEDWSNEWYEYYKNNASFVRIYATDPEFIAANDPGAKLYGYYDTWDEQYHFEGGYILNPSAVTAHYHTSSGIELAPSTTIVSSDSSITDYKVSQFVDWTTDPANPSFIQDKLDSLYYIGDELTLVPPVILGYITPTPHTLTLSEPTNEHTFVYQKIVTEVPFKDNKAVNSGELVEDATPPIDAKHPLITNSQLSLPEASTCQTISEAKLLSPTTLDSNQTVPDNITLLGGLDFTLGHCNEGSSTDVAYTLGQNIGDTSTLRVYKHNSITDETQDITDLITFTISDDGSTTISYSLTDGGELDQDGEANGTIVDPIYISMLTSSLSDLDSVNTGASSSDLAQTGSSVLGQLLISGISFIVAAGVLVTRRVVRSS